MDDSMSGSGNGRWKNAVQPQSQFVAADYTRAAPGLHQGYARDIPGSLPRQMTGSMAGPLAGSGRTNRPEREGLGTDKASEGLPDWVALCMLPAAVSGLDPAPASPLFTTFRLPMHCLGIVS